MAYFNKGKVYTDHALMDEVVYNTKIILKGIILKNSETADALETTDSMQQADLLLAIDNGSMDINIVPLDSTILHQFGYNDLQTRLILHDRSQVPEKDVKKLVEFASKWFVDNYVEYNDYYRTLNGLPPYGTKEYDIYIKPNNPLLYDDDANTFINFKLPLHQYTNQQIHTLTTLGIIDELKKEHKGDHGYKYLEFLGNKKISIVDARKAENWDILYFPFVEPLVAERFKELYNLNRRIYIYRTYQDAYKYASEYYDEMMMVMILSQTFTDMIVDIPEWYIRRDVFDLRTCQYFLESQGVKFFKQIPLMYQIRIVKSLNKLIRYKSTNKNIFDIINLFGVEGTTVYKYDIFKKYLYTDYYHYEDPIIDPEWRLTTLDGSCEDYFLAPVGTPLYEAPILDYRSKSTGHRVHIDDSVDPPRYIDSVTWDEVDPDDVEAIRWTPPDILCEYDDDTVTITQEYVDYDCLEEVITITEPEGLDVEDFNDEDEGSLPYDDVLYLYEYARYYWPPQNWEEEDFFDEYYRPDFDDLDYDGDYVDDYELRMYDFGDESEDEEPESEVVDYLVEEEEKKRVIIDEYNNVYDLEFIRVPVGESYDDYIKDSLYREDYDTLTENDRYWDGEDTHYFIRNKHLEKPFTLEGTKYMYLEYRVSMRDYTFQSSYFLGMIFSSRYNTEKVEISVPQINEDMSFDVTDLCMLLYCLSMEYEGKEVAIKEPRLQKEEKPDFEKYDDYNGGMFFDGGEPDPIPEPEPEPVWEMDLIYDFGEVGKDRFTYDDVFGEMYDFGYNFTLQKKWETHVYDFCEIGTTLYEYTVFEEPTIDKWICGRLYDFISDDSYLAPEWTPDYEPPIIGYKSNITGNACTIDDSVDPPIYTDNVTGEEVSFDNITVIEWEKPDIIAGYENKSDTNPETAPVEDFYNEDIEDVPSADELFLYEYCRVYYPSTAVVPRNYVGDNPDYNFGDEATDEIIENPYDGLTRFYDFRSENLWYIDYEFPPDPPGPIGPNWWDDEERHPFTVELFGGNPDAMDWYSREVKFDWYRIDANGGRGVAYSEITHDSFYDWINTDHPDWHVPLAGRIWGFNLSVDLDHVKEEIARRHSANNFEKGFTLEDFGCEQFIAKTEFESIEDMLNVYNVNQQCYNNIEEIIVNGDNSRDKLVSLYYVFHSLFTVPYDAELYRLKSGEIATSYVDLLRERNYTLYRFYLEVMGEDDYETRIDIIRDILNDIVNTLEYYIKSGDTKFVFSFVPTCSVSSIVIYIGLLIDFFKSWKVHFLEPRVAFVLDDKKENKVGSGDLLHETKIGYWYKDNLILRDTYTINPVLHVNECNGEAIEDLRNHDGTYAYDNLGRRIKVTMFGGLSCKSEVIDMYGYHVSSPTDTLHFDGTYASADDYADIDLSNYTLINGGQALDVSDLLIYLHGGNAMFSMKIVAILDGGRAIEIGPIAPPDDIPIDINNLVLYDNCDGGGVEAKKSGPYLMVDAGNVAARKRIYDLDCSGPMDHIDYVTIDGLNVMDPNNYITPIDNNFHEVRNDVDGGNVSNLLSLTKTMTTKVTSTKIENNVKISFYGTNDIVEEEDGLFLGGDFASKDEFDSLKYLITSDRYNYLDELNKDLQILDIFSSEEKLRVHLNNMFNSYFVVGKEVLEDYKLNATERVLTTYTNRRVAELRNWFVELDLFGWEYF